MARRAIGIASILLLVATALSAQAADNEIGPAVDTIYFRSFDVDRASRDLEAGNMDLYLYGLKIDAAQRLEGDEDFQLFQSPASTVSLLLNPAPARRGELNPFSIIEVRQAMHYLLDREFIARDIYRGMAVPMLTHVSRQDHDYLTVYDIERASGYGYDPEYGRELIDKAMRKAGATLEDGVWSYDGRPIRIKLIGRVEDERRNIADLVRTELEAAGFLASVSYLPFAAAALTVYSSDPASFDWHIYTEGWGRSSPQRYDYATANQMNAPWLGNMPGWQEIGFWQYENEDLDDLGKRLFRGEFESEDERIELYRRITELGLSESVRLWLVTATNSFPARAEVAGISRDLVAGLRAPWTLREAYIPGSDTLTVGHLWVWTERTTWNPIGGIGDVYSADIWRYLHDSPIWSHPFTGIPEAYRVDFSVESAGPSGTLAVPGDAVTWDAGADRWVPVGGGETALSEVVFDYSSYFASSWHHGAPITMADVVYAIAQSYELAYDPNKARIETAIGVTSRPFLETFRGFRLIDDNRLAVYVDYWHFEEQLIASYASPASLSMPWEILAGLDDLVFEQRRAAYSDTAASRFNVPWISLVMDRDARLLQRTLKTMQSRGTVPEGVFDFGGNRLVAAGDARARYQASLDWFDERGHLIISNGPFLLSRYDPPAQFAELSAFRAPGYPFGPGDWSFGEPPLLEIAPIDEVSVSAGRTAEIEVEVDGPGTLGVRYLLIDPVTREIVTTGDASPRGLSGGFTVALEGRDTRDLFPGFYELSLLAYSDSIVTVSERSVDLDVE